MAKKRRHASKKRLSALKRRRLRFEQLEERRMLAVDFGSIVQMGGDLFVPTDGLSDTDVLFSWTSPTTVDVTDNDTATTQTFMNVTGSLTFQNTNPAYIDDVDVDTGANVVGAAHIINAGDQADDVYIYGGGSIGPLTISSGAGGDDLDVFNTDVTGNVDVNAGAGNNTLNLFSSGVGGNFTFNGGGDMDMDF